MLGWIDDADRWLVERVQTLHTAPLDALFRWLSELPVRLALLAAAAAVVVALARNARAAVALAASLAAGIAVTVLSTEELKDVFDRPRPPDADPSIHPLVPVPANGAMPSGHASTAFCAAAVLAVFAPRFRAVFYAVAAPLALSRVWLGVHYPTDVLAGALLGLAVGLPVALAARAALRPDLERVS